MKDALHFCDLPASTHKLRTLMCGAFQGNGLFTVLLWGQVQTRRRQRTVGCSDKSECGDRRWVEFGVHIRRGRGMRATCANVPADRLAPVPGSHSSIGQVTRSN